MASKHKSHHAIPGRFHPPPGRLLTLDAIRGLWHPSGAVNGAGVFAVIWATDRGSWWAPLHDFEHAAVHKLVEQCRAMDQGAQWARTGSPW